MFAADDLSLSSKKYMNELSFANKHLKLDDLSSCRKTFYLGETICNQMSSARELKVLRLEGNSLGVKAATAIGNSLRSHKTLERLILNDLFTGRLKNEIPLALTELFSGILNNARLVELNLSDNAFGPNGMNSVAVILKSPCCFSLKELRLHNNGLGIEGAKKLASALNELALVPGRFKLRVFICGRNRLENEGAIALADVFSKASTLEEIQMPQNGIHNTGLLSLFRSFSKHPKLRIINLNDNTLKSSGMKTVSKIISGLSNLEHLNLGDCLLENEGAVALSLSLQKHERLKELILSSNEIEFTGAAQLLANLRTVPSLQFLDLDSNRIGCKGIRTINKEWNSSSLNISIQNDEEEDATSSSEASDDECNDHGADYMVRAISGISLNSNCSDCTSSGSETLKLEAQANRSFFDRRAETSTQSTDSCCNSVNEDDETNEYASHSKKYAWHDRSSTTFSAAAADYHTPSDVQNALVFKGLQQLLMDVNKSNIEVYTCSLLDFAFLWNAETPSRKELTDFIDGEIQLFLAGTNMDVHKMFANSLLVAIGLLKPESKKLMTSLTKNRCEMLAYILKQTYSNSFKDFVIDYVRTKSSSKIVSDSLLPLLK